MDVAIRGAMQLSFQDFG